MKKLKNAGVLRFSSRFFIALQIDPSGAKYPHKYTVGADSISARMYVVDHLRFTGHFRWSVGRGLDPSLHCAATQNPQRAVGANSVRPRSFVVTLDSTGDQ